MKTNQKGIDLITSFEGFRAKSYRLEGESYFTIGYGHSFDASITASTVWTKEKAIEVLKKDLSRFENYVTQYAKQYGFSFNENQFSALVSYCYNRGPGGIKQLFANTKHIDQMADNIVLYWGSAVLYKNGLVRRRKEERKLFLTPVVTPKPKPIAPKPLPVKKTVKKITYTVQRGDTLSEIATKYGVTVASITKQNKIANPNRIAVGQKIVIVK